MKSKNSFIHAAAVAAITIGFSCVANAQTIYSQGVPVQRAPQQGSGSVVGAPQVYRACLLYTSDAADE